jgi:hypothetical protein
MVGVDYGETLVQQLTAEPGPLACRVDTHQGRYQCGYLGWAGSICSSSASRSCCSRAPAARYAGRPRRRRYAAGLPARPASHVFSLALVA